jgi:hypothetical protein
VADPTTLQQIADGKDLDYIRQHPGFAVLERMLEKRKHDLVEAFASNSTMSRKELKGALETLAEIVPAVDEAIRLGQDAEAEEREANRHGLTVSRATEGDDLV